MTELAQANDSQRLCVAILIILGICIQPALFSSNTAAVSMPENRVPISLAYPFKIGINQTAYLESADLGLRFVNVTEDSRCPTDVQCIWAGQVSIVVEVVGTSTEKAIGNFSFTLLGESTTDLPTVTVAGYDLKLSRVEPYPISNRTIDLSEYVATLVVLPESEDRVEMLVVSNPVAIDDYDSLHIAHNITAGKQVIFSIALHNGFARAMPYVAIMEGRSMDDGGITRFLVMPYGVINARGWIDLGLSWIPEAAGDYELRVFLIDNLDHPQPLTPVIMSRIRVADAGAADTLQVINGNNQFALNLYTQLVESGEQGNLFYSPWSISTALALVYEGAQGRTADEIESVFSFPDDDNLRRSSFSAVHRDLNDNQGYTLTTSNALWIKKGYPLSEAYVNVARESYTSDVSEIDFVDKDSRSIINNWVEAETNHRIKDLIPEGVLDELTRLVITNAIYFKGTWVTQFDEHETISQEFTTGSGIRVSVPMMKIEKARFKYAETDSLQVIEIPYEGDKLSMLILLPKGIKQLGIVERSLTLDKLEELRRSLSNQTVTVLLPKFKLETQYELGGLLTDLGMPTAFDPENADLSGITDMDRLYIATAMHKAFVEVNEEGTEAAAATGVIIGTTSVQEYPVFRADHPFTFMIQDSETGNILFIGRLADPSG